MVKQGDFVVTLVNAESDEPFPEHRGPDGKDYIEVEPNAEYWIRIQSNQIKGCVLCDLYVDGEDLGYRTCVKQAPVICGIWSNHGNQSTEQSLAVKAVRGVNGREAFWIGQVRADIFDGVERTAVVTSTTPTTDFVSTWNGGKGAAKSCKASEKVVASHIGTKTVVTVASSQNDSGDGISIGPGQLLQSFTLYYCTAVGLIHVGVLPKPETWEYHRKLHPADATAVLPAYLANLEPEIMTQTTQDQSGTVVEEKFYEMFDLTGIDDNDSDDSDDSDDD